MILLRAMQKASYESQLSQHFWTWCDVLHAFYFTD